MGYLLKGQCADNAWADSFQYRRLCYNDLQPLYGVRGISRGLLPYRDVSFEYPVITGMFMDLAGRALRGLVKIGVVAKAGDAQYFRLSALGLAPFAFIAAFHLRKMTPARRLMLFVAAPPLAVYAFHNWDLIAVAATAWALRAHEAGRFATSGIAASLGMSAKLFPAFMAPGIFLDRLKRSDRKGAFRVALGFVLAALVVNVPWIFIASGVSPVFADPSLVEIAQSVELRDPSTNGWMGIWLFHAERYPDFGTAWYWLAHHGRVLIPSGFWQVGSGGYADAISLVSFLMFAIGSAATLLWHYRRKGDGFPVAAAGLSVTVLFLLVSKVHSPQYALWLLPFLALLDVRVRAVLAYFALDLAVFVSGFYYFTVMHISAPAWMGVFEVAVLARTAALGWLFVQSLRAKRTYPAQISQQNEISSRT